MATFKDFENNSSSSPSRSITNTDQLRILVSHDPGDVMIETGSDHSNQLMVFARQ